ncbi:BETA-GLUCOSIDASE 6-LIKE [Salix purpurea]|uniref:BETA-GLUCOSIDASE 6-LIKE n=1 Tax=Salix purpurea TaxID=77065 RepID=A0A9Q0Z9X2_SALPP|nr:BETA-GLUCOSIDASE 6-LIKE [Salix purpurea]
MLPRRGIAWVVIVLVAFEIQTCLSQINRASFPKGFVFGTASSAFQYEGAVKEDGRGPSVWDKFSHTFGKIIDFSNADVAVDQFHLFDVHGTGKINQAGVDHYNKFINALLAQGIEPYVTLFHWDLPQALHDRYNGWLSSQIIKDFATFAETCFQNYGDREDALSFSTSSAGLETQQLSPYIVAHNMLLSHGVAADIYRKKYKAKQQGSLGISLDVMWFEPATNSTNDIEAAQRAQDFQLGWDLVGKVLNDSLADSGAITLPFGKKLKPIGDRANSIWLYIVPQGMRSLMNYIRQKYGNPPVIITENGMDDPNNPLTSIKDALKDGKRIKYHNDYLTNLLASIKYGSLAYMPRHIYVLDSMLLPPMYGGEKNTGGKHASSIACRKNTNQNPDTSPQINDSRPCGVSSMGC